MRIFKLSPRSTIWRTIIIVATILLCILLPFALWGQDFDVLALQWVQSGNSGWELAMLGIVLLTLDVILPIPSSVVSITLCISLGPVKGGLVIMAGMTSGFLLGDTIGRVVPKEVIRVWVGTEIWNVSTIHAEKYGLAWLAWSRPIPVFAEFSAILSGILRISLKRSVPIVILSSGCVALAYGITTWIGFQQTSLIAAILTVTIIPSIAWLVFKSMLNR